MNWIEWKNDVKWRKLTLFTVSDQLYRVFYLRCEMKILKIQFRE